MKALGVAALLLGLTAWLRFPDVLLDLDPRWVWWPAFVLVAIVLPLLLTAWTLRRPGRVLRAVGAAGLVVTAARSLVWLTNAALPPDRGLYLTSAILTTASLLLLPVWLVWLSGLRRLTAALVTPLAVIVYAVATIQLTPARPSNRVPAVPSAIGSVFYLVPMAFPQVVGLPENPSELRASNQRTLAEPPAVQSWATRTDISANGVRSEWICARTATKDHAILYLPGGGFTSEAGNGPRRWAATISQQTNACVLLAHYRLLPYPAGHDDSITAYRWLLQQTGSADRIAVMGDSAGGNLTLTTALTLKKYGVPLPAALVSLSGVADLSLTGKTFRTLANRDPILSPGQRKLVYDSYTKNGTLNTHDPLMSPLYADPTGLPPTMLMVGSQEVLLSDIQTLAAHFKSAGVHTDLTVWPGMLHAFPLVLEEAPETTLANARIGRFITQAWSARGN